MKEKLSALIDSELNELDERRVLNALRDDAELRAAWERYHVIRGAVTRQLGTVLRRDFAERVLARLEVDVHAGAQRLRLWPLAGGFAAAVAVAGAAILGAQLLRTPDGPLAPLAATPPANEVASAPVNAATTAASAELATASADLAAAAAEPAPIEVSGGRLDAYLVGHNEFMPTAGMGSMLPYVRVVTHRPDADAPAQPSR